MQLSWRGGSAMKSTWLLQREDWHRFPEYTWWLRTVIPVLGKPMPSSGHWRLLHTHGPQESIQTHTPTRKYLKWCPEWKKNPRDFIVVCFGFSFVLFCFVCDYSWQTKILPLHRVCNVFQVVEWSGFVLAFASVTFCFYITCSSTPQQKQWCEELGHLHDCTLKQPDARWIPPV